MCQWWWVKAGPEEIEVPVSDGCVVHGLLYRADGAEQGAPLCLCIHGLGVDANVWAFVAPRLQCRGISALCLDLRGHGLSDQGGWLKLNARRMARDIYCVCRKLDLEPSFLLAQSFGTHVGLEVLRRYQQRLNIRAFYAVTPVWIGSRRSMTAIPGTVSTTFRFLRSLGRHIGYTAPRIRRRRDHARYAGFPDSYMPRFIEEAASISWVGYARLLIWLRLQSWWARDAWARYARYPVRVIAAVDDGLWNNRELETVHRKTGWPLHWMAMRHISLATEESYADGLMEILEQDPEWPLKS